jgi:hypothetical protein
VKKKTAGRSPKRGAPKKAPLAVGSRKGSSASGAPDAKLARIEQDLGAAIDEAIASLKKLRNRLDELSTERAAPEAQTLLAAAMPMGPSRLTTD